jgi:hypothetical protein
VLFDPVLRVVNQIFRRAAALFDGTPRRSDAIVDRISGGFLYALDFGAQLVTDFYSFFNYLGLHCYFLPDS